MTLDRKTATNLALMFAMYLLGYAGALCSHRVGPSWLDATYAALALGGLVTGAWMKKVERR